METKRISELPLAQSLDNAEAVVNINGTTYRVSLSSVLKGVKVNNSAVTINNGIAEIKLKTINNQSITGEGNIEIQGGGGTITDILVNGSSVVDSEGVARISIDLSGYVEKEEGKGLSSNDYTTEEKEKLADIDVQALTARIAALESNVEIPISVETKTCAASSPTLFFDNSEFPEGSRCRVVVLHGSLALGYALQYYKKGDSNVRVYPDGLDTNTRIKSSVYEFTFSDTSSIGNSVGGVRFYNQAIPLTVRMEIYAPYPSPTLLMGMNPNSEAQPEEPIEEQPNTDE